MIQEDTVKLLRECDAGVKMGVSSIDDTLEYVHSPQLKRCLTQSKRDHQALEGEIRGLLHQYHDQGKNPNPIAKGMSWMKTNVKLGMDASDQTVAELMTDGCNMGVKSLSRYLNQYEAAEKKPSLCWTFSTRCAPPAKAGGAFLHLCLASAVGYEKTHAARDEVSQLRQSGQGLRGVLSTVPCQDEQTQRHQADEADNYYLLGHSASLPSLLRRGLWSLLQLCGHRRSLHAQEGLFILGKRKANCGLRRRNGGPFAASHPGTDKVAEHRGHGGAYHHIQLRRLSLAQLIGKEIMPRLDQQHRHKGQEQPVSQVHPPPSPLNAGHYMLHTIPSSPYGMYPLGKWEPLPILSTLQIICLCPFQREKLWYNGREKFFKKISGSVNGFPLPGRIHGEAN